MLDFGQPKLDFTRTENFKKKKTPQEWNKQQSWARVSQKKYSSDHTWMVHSMGGDFIALGVSFLSERIVSVESTDKESSSDGTPIWIFNSIVIANSTHNDGVVFAFLYKYKWQMVSFSG